MAADAFRDLLARLLPAGRAWRDRHFATWDPVDGTSHWFSSSLTVGEGGLPRERIAVPRLALVWLLRGRASFRCPDSSWAEIPEGGYFVRFPGMEHGIRLVGSGQPAFWTLTLPPGAAQFLAGIGVDSGHPVGGPIQDADLLRRAAELHHQLRQGQDPLPLQATALVLITDFLRFRRVPSPEAVLAQRLSALRSGDLVAAVAREFHLSQSRLRHRFSARYGLAPERWRQRERLRQAHRLLTTGELAADDVARRCGWGGGRAMAKAFRKAFGYPPSACRPSED